MRSRTWAALAAALLWGSTACATAMGAGRPVLTDDSPQPSEAASVHSEPTSSAAVTREHYEDAVHRTKDCMAKSSVELVSYGWDPIDQQGPILGYKAAKKVPENEVFEVARKCRAKHLNAVEARFSANNKALMVPKLMAAVQRCLDGKGVPVTGREKNSSDLLAVVPKDQLMDLLDCVHQNANSLYPGLPIEFP
ncbi:hypothetical protein [Streptosporangium sp. H16]|uniref:hypothetical protein n=1 Tax=Streptosporangium sp. H16 TaxID=3444184 RepID=UPI003F7AEA1C